MKGVTFIRITTRPAAQCQHMECGWYYPKYGAPPPVTIRSNAQKHVKTTGHIVEVIVSDVTEYSREAS